VCVAVNKQRKAAELGAMTEERGWPPSGGGEGGMRTWVCVYVCVCVCVCIFFFIKKRFLKIFIFATENMKFPQI
jgi:hypothetical protein